MTPLDIRARAMLQFQQLNCVKAVAAYFRVTEDRCSAMCPPWGNATTLQKSGFCVRWR